MKPSGEKAQFTSRADGHLLRGDLCAILLDQPGKWPRADNCQRRLHVAEPHRPLPLLIKIPQLLLDMQRIHINKAGFASNAQPLELEAADEARQNMAHETGLLPRLPCRHIGRRQSPDGIALWNDPTPTAAAGHQEHINGTIGIGLDREGCNLSEHAGRPVGKRDSPPIMRSITVIHPTFIRR